MRDIGMGSVEMRAIGADAPAARVLAPGSTRTLAAARSRVFSARSIQSPVEAHAQTFTAARIQASAAIRAQALPVTREIERVNRVEGPGLQQQRGDLPPRLRALREAVQQDNGGDICHGRVEEARAPAIHRRQIGGARRPAVSRCAEGAARPSACHRIRAGNRNRRRSKRDAIAAAPDPPAENVLHAPADERRLLFEKSQTHGRPISDRERSARARRAKAPRPRSG